MLEITRIDHVGVVAPELAPQLAVLEGLFGFQREREWENDREGYRGVSLRVPGDTRLRWEVLAPQGEGSSLQAFIDSPRGPGLHHLAVEVADLDAAEAELRRLGIEATRDSGGGDRTHELTIDAERGGHGFQFHLIGPGAREGGDGAATAADGDPPSLGVVAVDHLCHAYRDREELRDWYEQTFGMREIWRTPIDEHPDFADLVLEIPGQRMVWEIIQPRGEESFIDRFLDTRGPAVHHVAFEVADWDRAMAAAEHHEAPIFDEHDDQKDGIRYRDAFIHPKYTGGVLAQIYWEEQPDTWIRSDKIRPPAR